MNDDNEVFVDAGTDNVVPFPTVEPDIELVDRNEPDRPESVMFIRPGSYYEDVSDHHAF